MLILGLDPGTRVAGYGLVEAIGSKLRLVGMGVFSAPASAPVEERLAVIARGLREVVLAHRPDTAAMEDAFVRVDPRAALLVGQGRGALLAVLGEGKIPVRSYPPASVKRSVAGNGRAPKEQVARMVAAILKEKQLPGPLDATDAVAVAITHALARSTEALLGQRLT
ncbi:MAG TPA: crossover junction endodeoxyribonuclease RuvC [Planctomycetota bacterium]|nr:crossover junction endodeoxyribonuclease RuvC [Planctomycetota bacterium]